MILIDPSNLSPELQQAFLAGNLAMMDYAKFRKAKAFIKDALSPEQYAVLQGELQLDIQGIQTEGTKHE